MKTIRELAESAGVSKTAIRQRLKDLDLMQRTERDERNVLFVPDEVAEDIIASFRNRPVKPAENPQKAQETPQGKVPQSENKAFTDVLDVLTEQLRAKDKQIDALQSANQQLQETIKALSASLTNAQALHAGTLQQLLNPVHVDDLTPTAATEGSTQTATENEENAGSVAGTPLKAEEPPAAPQTPQTAPPTTTPPTEEKPVEKPKRGFWGIFRR